MTGIFFSTVQEASVFLKAYEYGRFDGLSEGEFLEDGRIMVAVTGVGKIKATLRTERFIRAKRPNKLLHIGTSSKLNSNLETGTLLAIDQVFEGDRIELAMPVYPRMPLETPFTKLKTATLVSQDHAPKEAKDRVYWQRIADVSDMEGYPIAYVAASHGIPVHIVKVLIGDVKSDDATLKRILQTAYQQLSTFLLGAIQTNLI